MAIKAIGFDYGGVIKGNPGAIFGAGITNILGVTDEQFYQAYYRHNKAVNRGEITWPTLWKLVLSDLNKFDKFQEVMDLHNQVYNQSLNSNMLELVDTLRKSGYKVGLLSNNTLDEEAKMMSFHLEQHFDVLHVSASTGFVKPEPEAFNTFIKDLGVAMDELVFIDDSEKSLSTAKDCGYTPILFKSYEQLIAALQQLGITVR